MTRWQIRSWGVDRRADPAADLDGMARRVQALARSRFSASPAALDRIEARVASAFRLAGHPVLQVQPASNWRPRWRHWFPRWSAVIVALMAVTGSGAVASAESRAGHSLYGVRIAVESAALPAAATDRVDAQVTRLNRRIDEAVEAGLDDRAVLDAMHAYRATLGELTELADAHPDQGLAIVRALDHQISSLERLVATTDETIRPEVNRAILGARVARVMLDPRRERHRPSVERQVVGHGTRAR